MNQHGREVSPTNKTKPYIESDQRHPNIWFGGHGENHRSLELAFDPGKFSCDSSKAIAYLCVHGFYGSAGERVKAESDNG